MNDSDTSHPQLKIALEQALKTLQDPHCDPSKPNYKSVTSLFHKIDFFHRVFNSPLELEEFIEVSKYYWDHEVHSYGTILMKEKEHAKKFCLILKGTAHKLHQRPYADVEFEFKKSKVKTKTNSQHGSDNEPNSATNKANPFSERLERLDTSNSDKNNMKISRGSRKFYSEVIPTVPKSGSENTDSKNGSSKFAIRRGGVKLIPTSTTLKASKFANKDISPTFGSMEKLCFLKTYASVFDASPKEKLDSDNESKKSHDNEKKRTSRDKNQIIFEFVTDLVSKNPDINQRCFLGDTIRVEISQTYHPGEYFGENFLKQTPPKESSMIAVCSEEIHMLTLTKENFKTILDELSKREKERTQLFNSLFPSFEENLIHNFSQYFNRRQYRTGETIYHQNDKAQSLCLLKIGNISFIKDIEIVNQLSTSRKGKWVNWTSSSSGRKVELPLASIVGGQFFGEELLLKEQFRQYHAISNTPDTIVYTLELELYRQIQLEYKALFDVLRANAEEKFAWREQKVSEFVEHQKLFAESQMFEPALPELWKNKSVPLARSSTVFPKESLDEVNTNITQNSEPRYLKTENSTLHRSHFSLSHANQEVYKEKFSRKVKPLPQGSREGNTLFEFNLRKEFEAAKTSPKVRLPSLHSPKKSVEVGKKGSVIHSQCNNSSTSGSPKSKNEEQLKFSVNDLSPKYDRSPGDKIVNEKDELKKMFKHINYVPARPNFFNTNLESILMLENTLS